MQVGHILGQFVCDSKWHPPTPPTRPQRRLQPCQRMSEPWRNEWGHHRGCTCYSLACTGQSLKALLSSTPWRHLSQQERGRSTEFQRCVHCGWHSKRKGNGLLTSLIILLLNAIWMLHSSQPSFQLFFAHRISLIGLGYGVFVLS